jgi:hypothetical protein
MDDVVFADLRIAKDCHVPEQTGARCDVNGPVE